MVWLEGGILMSLLIVWYSLYLYTASTVFLRKLAGPCKLKSGWWYQIIWTATAVHMAFAANLMTSRNLKTTVFVKSREEIEWPQFPKLWPLRCPNFLRDFSPLRFVGFCLWFGLGPWLPEAARRCTWQPGTAATRLSSGSSRRRRPWMRRATWAVASGGMRDGSPLWEEVDEDVDGSSFLRSRLHPFLD